MTGSTGGHGAAPLDRGTGVALWRQVEEILAAEIAAVDLDTSTRLPSENELAARFRVNRHTIRQALSSLQQRGLVQIEQGRGTFIVARRITYALGARTRFSENLERVARRATGRLLRSATVFADSDLAHDLAVAPGTLLGQIDTVRDADGRRLCVSSHFYPAARFPGLADAFGRSGSMTEALRLLGVTDYRRSVTRITAQLPTVEDARFLHIPRNRPVMVTESVDVDPAGTPVQYGVTRFVGDLVKLVVEGAGEALEAAAET
ncbi:MAG: phosphonate metabolism transcriptional regulator PhnF [Rhodospirillaceae bacterium]|nr:phosphonate metabolism transcriptional regulator PhnF [Rhodospirillaceae bacterium]